LHIEEDSSLALTKTNSNIKGAALPMLLFFVPNCQASFINNHQMQAPIAISPQKRKNWFYQPKYWN
jgi:hypothetical protein